MKIYFPEIVFQNNPLVWELDETTGKATCLFYCINQNSKSIAQIYIIGLLKKIPGIEIINNVAFIENLALFNKKYTPLLIETSSSPNSNNHMLKQSSTFFSPGLTSPIASSSATVDDASSASDSDCESSFPTTYEHIDLDSLIPAGNAVIAPIWGETVAFEKHFQDKNNNDAKTHPASFLKSSSTFNALLQYEISPQINHLKCQVITSIRGLLSLLDPIYGAWCLQLEGPTSQNELSLDIDDKNLFFTYLQKAVLQAMLNSPYNNKPTEFEEMDSSEIDPDLQKFCDHQIRVVRAKAMLIKFRVLIEGNLAVGLAINKNEKSLLPLLPILKSFQKFFLEQPIKVQQEISTKLEEIIAVIIPCGKAEFASQKLFQKLNHDLEIKSPSIRNCLSFSSRLFMILSPSEYLHGKQDLIPDIIQQATSAAIQKIEILFSSDKRYTSYIAPLYVSLHQDFYLCMNWAEKLIPELRKIILKHPKDEKKIIAYCDAIAEAVIDFIGNQLEELPNPSPTVSFNM